MKNEYVLAADIGGGHISSAVVDLSDAELLLDTRAESRVDSKGERDGILDAWAGCLNTSLQRVNASTLAGIAFAMPGPFDYRSGTARFGASDKYESLRDVVIPELLTPRLDCALDMRFINDATAFGIGEAHKLAETQEAVERVLTVTLGTGFGSAFLDNGVPVTSGDSVPVHGCLWHLPFRGGIFDDFVSVRWLLSQFAAIRDEPIRGVREIAAFAREDHRCAAIFHQYGSNLGFAVADWITRFGAQSLIIGGNIVGAYDLFSASLAAALASGNAEVPVILAQRTEDSAIAGAARLFEDRFWHQIKKELPTI